MSIRTKNASTEVLYERYHDSDRDGPVSDTLVEALATVEGVDPVELDVRLYDSVDADAIDRLYEVAGRRDERLRVSFTVGGYEVVLEGDGRILVRERSGP